MEAMEVPHILTFGIEWGEGSASRPGRFTYREETPGTYWFGGWVGSKSGSDALQKRETLLSLPAFEQTIRRTPCLWPSHYTDCAVRVDTNVLGTSLVETLITPQS